MQALKTVAAKGLFDLVLLDDKMPGMNRLQGLHKALKKFPEQPFAIISGTMGGNQLGTADRILGALRTTRPNRVIWQLQTAVSAIGNCPQPWAFRPRSGAAARGQIRGHRP